jgi:hypothetical protein
MVQCKQNRNSTAFTLLAIAQLISLNGDLAETLLW